MPRVVRTYRLDPDVLAKLNRLARALNNSEGTIVERAVMKFYDELRVKPGIGEALAALERADDTVQERRIRTNGGDPA